LEDWRTNRQPSGGSIGERCGPDCLGELHPNIANDRIPIEINRRPDHRMARVYAISSGAERRIAFGSQYWFNRVALNFRSQNQTIGLGVIFYPPPARRKNLPLAKVARYRRGVASPRPSPEAGRKSGPSGCRAKQA
jgi:hypothetical protein